MQVRKQRASAAERFGGDGELAGLVDEGGR